jgi:hypothetical protein
METVSSCGQVIAIVFGATFKKQPVQSFVTKVEMTVNLLLAKKPIYFAKDLF